MSDETSRGDRITEVHIQGMRALADVRLPLGGLTVLIGENGSGKTTIIEALELLRRAATPGNFISDQLLPFHGGLPSLLRAGERTLCIAVHIEGDGPPIDYAFALSGQGGLTIISEEHLDLWSNPDADESLRVISRDAGTCEILDTRKNQRIPLNVTSGELAMTRALMIHGTEVQPALARVVSAFSMSRVHVPFDIRPGWLLGRAAPMRLPAQLGVAGELERLGHNLANCYHKLWNGSTHEQRERTLERVRAGLGADVVNVRTPAVGPSQIELFIDFRGIPKPIPAFDLSDGQLAYLAFVALAELSKDHSFLAFDEPESHMHPELLVRIVWLLEELVTSCPVILSTHSDRLLDALSEPAKSVILCELDEARATQLYRPEPEALEKWLKRYRGIGELRSQGYAPHVFREPMRTGT